MTKTAAEQLVALTTPAAQESTILALPQLCGCATCKEAVDAALKLADQLYEHQCSYYITQIGAVLLSYAKTAGILSDIQGNTENLGRELTKEELTQLLIEGSQDFNDRQVLMGHFIGSMNDEFTKHVESKVTKKHGH